MAGCTLYTRRLRHPRCSCHILGAVKRHDALTDTKNTSRLKIGYCGRRINAFTVDTVRGSNACQQGLVWLLAGK